MNTIRIIGRSLCFYRRAGLGVLIGTALTGMIMTGALLVGDSVDATLRTIALQRIGETELVMPAGYYRTGLADRLGSALARPTAPILNLRGVDYSREEIAWLQGPLKMRFIGASYCRDNDREWYYRTMSLSQEYDGIVYVGNSSPTTQITF